MVYPQMIPGKGQPLGAGGGAADRASGIGSSSAISSAGPGGGGGPAGASAGLGAGGSGVMIPGVVGGLAPGPGREGPSALGSVSTAAAALKAEKYESRLFGFKVNEEARLARWRTARREE